MGPFERHAIHVGIKRMFKFDIKTKLLIDCG